jgi:hypothetical protein
MKRVCHFQAKVCDRTLTDQITQLVHSTLGLPHLHQQLARSALSAQSQQRPINSNASASKSTRTVTTDIATETTIETLAEAYANTCALLWPIACHSLYNPVFNPPAEHLRAAYPSAKPTCPNNLTPRSEALQQQLQILCYTWAIGKRFSSAAHAHPPFYQDDLTIFAALRATWQQPAIQTALQRITTQLTQSHTSSLDTANDSALKNWAGIWIGQHPTCWAYLFGTVMHQLLQWNHQLTPQMLRELWP